MKKIAVLILAYILSANFMFAETQSIIYPSTITVYKYKQNDNPYYDRSITNTYLGRYNGKSLKDEETYRLILKLDLSSIPDSALITFVSFSFGHWLDSIPFTFRIAKFNYNTSGAQNEWNACNTGPIYRSSNSTTLGSIYDFSYSDPNDTLLISAMESALASNEFAICLVSDDESTNRKFSDVIVGSVAINYVVPKIIVNNNFGGGNILVNGEVKPSGSEIYSKVGNQITLEAYNQIYQDTMRYFESWQLPGNNYHTQPTYQFTVLKGNAYATQTYRANYGNPVSFTVKNSFNGGIIRVDLDTVQSGTVITRPQNQQVTLGSIAQEYGGYNRIWNNYMPQAKSNWQKGYSGLVPFDINGAINPNYVFQTSISDTNAIYIADMKKNYRIYRIADFTEFDNIVNQGLQAQIVEQNSGQISAPAQQTINNKTYNFACWSDGNGNNPRAITPQNNEDHTALYKYPHHSNYSSAFSNNGQRKTVRRISDNDIYLVYESMGKIWLERSTNNGSTWCLVNGGKPISFGTAKHPAITHINGHNFVIVYQALNPDDSYNITAAYYTWYTDQVLCYSTVINQDSKMYSEDATIVIGNSSSGINDFLVVWHEDDYGTFLPGGLYYKLGKINTAYSTIQWFDSGLIPTTTENSVNPTIGCKPEQNSYPIKFHLIWQNNVDTSTSTIKYREITYNGQQLTLGTEQVLSNGSGYTKNHNPSTTVMNDNIPRVTWRGERTVIIDEEEKEILDKIQSTTTQSKVLFTDPSVSYFWGFGLNVGKPTINRSTDNLKYYMAWSEPYLGALNGKSVSNNLNGDSIKTLSGLTGTDIQVVNGATDSEIRAVSLNNSGGLPYNFQISIMAPSPLKKEELVLSGIGREGVVYHGSAQFYFMIGDVIVNGSEVDFVDVPALTVFSSDSVLNRYMQTETFTLNNTSEFLYSVQYGVTDSAIVADYLQDGKSISFAVELIDASTGALLGKFDEVTFNSQNIYQYDNLSYEVNTEGIGNREVYLRLATNNNGNVSRSLTIVGADASLIAKRHTKKVGFNGIAAVTDYALSQNYPNPFNPVTTINYQIPKDGFVSLKVYDILGKEIATLVNSDKAQGKYTVEFDGSRFASGMYIYKLQSGDFVETRKMMLLK